MGSYGHPVVIRLVRSSSLWLVASSLAACGTLKDSPRPGPMPQGAPIEIQDAAGLSLGVMQGDSIQEFNRVVTPFLLADGRLVVPSSGASSIRVFSPTGEFEKSLGRPGEGPGEFRHLQAAWPRGDTIEAFDNRLKRVTRFLPDGSIDVVTVRSTLRDLSAVAGPFADGWLLGGVATGGMGRRDEMVGVESVRVHSLQRR